MRPSHIRDPKENGSSRFNQCVTIERLCLTHTILLDQMTQYPYRDYVDSLDALSGAVENVAKAKKVLRINQVVCREMIVN
ncbi:hypothetical protein [Chengkuizengella marina]|uniref:Uncharacterized protein n=1 Tax=Chengkuizengella marina TaxID=2507566 RepID=A0A6N9Q8R1_9BACL|nr:hypothetical protein [Chengkuizengella marina]NBI31219.1 hypothetical protein [Chengkuizengella marina]